MKQLQFDNMDEQDRFVIQIEDIELYTKAVSSLIAIIKRDLKARGSAAISRNSFIFTLSELATTLNLFLANQLSIENKKIDEAGQVLAFAAEG